MKRTSTLLFLALSFAAAKAQTLALPNFSFENWTSGVPDNWQDQNGGGSITQSTDAYVGTKAVKGTLVISGANTYTPTLASQGSFSVTQQYTYLRFYYKTNLASASGGNDEILIDVQMNNGATGVGHPTPNSVIPGNNIITSNSSVYKIKQVKMTYTGTPTTATIVIKANPTNTDTYAHLGTWFLIDSISFSNTPVGIDEFDEASSTLQVFPIPAKDQLKIKAMASKPFQITFSDALGRVIYQRMSVAPINGVIQDVLRLDSISSGLYMLMLTSEKKTVFKRVIVD